MTCVKSTKTFSRYKSEHVTKTAGILLAFDISAVLGDPMASALPQGLPRISRRESVQNGLKRRLLVNREPCRQMGKVAAGSCEDIGKVSFVSLGCPKNTVDGKINRDLKENGGLVLCRNWGLEILSGIGSVLHASMWKV